MNLKRYNGEFYIMEYEETEKKSQIICRCTK